MEPYMKMAFMTARSIVQAGMLPNWDDLLSIGIFEQNMTLKNLQTVLKL